MSLIQQTFVVGSFQCNCRLIVCSETGMAALVDPGDEPQKIIAELEKVPLKNGVSLKIQYLLHTHGHLDHIGGTRGVAETLERKTGQRPVIALHKGDHPLYQNLKMQGQLFGMQYDDPSAVDRFLEDEESIGVGNLRFSVIHTPGHSPGSVCFRLHEDKGAGARETLYSGDTLFQGSVGRTDLWGADQDQMFRSIRQRILSLDDDTRVCPGHGEDSWVGVEKRSNPFLT